MRWTGIMLFGALMSGCGDGEEAALAPGANERIEAAERAVPAPDLAACPEVPKLDDGPAPRTEPVAVPASFNRIMKADTEQLAVSTLAGGTVCVDTTWISEIEDAKAVTDERFISFDWYGYEAFGHMLVDRAGSGTVIDTGEKPAFSPSGKLVAGLQVSEAGWGGLEGFAIWRVTPAGLAPLHDETSDDEGEIPWFIRQEMSLWRIDNWVGEECVAISAASWPALEAVGADVESAKRTPFHARRADDWEIRPGPPEGCPRS
jgi:hypothetical protein